MDQDIGSIPWFWYCHTTLHLWGYWMMLDRFANTCYWNLCRRIRSQPNYLDSHNYGPHISNNLNLYRHTISIYHHRNSREFSFQDSFDLKRNCIVQGDTPHHKLCRWSTYSTHWCIENNWCFWVLYISCTENHTAYKSLFPFCNSGWFHDDIQFHLLHRCMYCRCYFAPLTQPLILWIFRNRSRWDTH